MLPAYTLVVDITATVAVEEEGFQELIAPCLIYLDALKGAFDRKPCDVVLYPPQNQHQNSTKWSARCVLTISLGKERAKYLMQLYQAIARLITLEFPNLEIRHEMTQFDFS